MPTAEYIADRADAPHVLVLRSTTHSPPGWDRKYHTRVRGHMEPRWFAAFYIATIAVQR